MAKKAAVTAEFHLGDLVRIKGLNNQIGRVIELRGPLGPGGEPVYRVRISRRLRKSYIELLGDQLELLPRSGDAEGTKPMVGRGQKAGEL